MTVETEFGPLLRKTRQRAGLGLRTFATLLEERASTVSAIESCHCQPWRRESQLRRIASLLGINSQSPAWDKLRQAAHRELAKGVAKGVAELVQERPGEFSTEKAHDTFFQLPTGSKLLWWMTEERARLSVDAPALANYLGASLPECLDASSADDSTKTLGTRLTDLEIESRVRQLLGRRTAQLATAPVDIESVLEIPASSQQRGVRLEIIPGLLPRFSVQAALVRSTAGLTIVVDRIMADSRPIAGYRFLLAKCYAPWALDLFSTAKQDGMDQNNSYQSDPDWLTNQFTQLRCGNEWPRIASACARFALAMLLPANPLAAAAQSTYAEIIRQHDPVDGWPQPGIVLRYLRNRMAEQFAVPPNMVAKRMSGWPCHITERVALALTAEEPSLPPLDWLDQQSWKQRTLFAL